MKIHSRKRETDEDGEMNDRYGEESKGFQLLVLVIVRLCSAFFLIELQTKILVSSH